MTTLTLPWLDGGGPRDLGRWAFAAALVLAVHVGGIAYYLDKHQPEEIGDQAEVVTVELAPIDSTPDAVERDVAPAPQTMVESKPVPEPPKEKPPEQQIKVEEPPPPPDQTPTIIPEPTPKPPEVVEQPKPPAPRTAERVKGGVVRRHIAPSWQSKLVRHLQRYKRYPSEAQARSEQGVVLLSFSLDRNGHVLSRRIVRSSGYPILDDEVMAMIARAEPLPAFPASMPERQLDITVPIQFTLR